MLRPRALSHAHIYNNIVVETICAGRKALDVSFGEREKKNPQGSSLRLNLGLSKY